MWENRLTNKIPIMKSEIRMLKSLTTGGVLVAASLLATQKASAIDPYTGEGTPVIGASVVTTGGDVTATFIHGSGSYSDYLYLEVVSSPFSNPGGNSGVSGNWIFDNHLSSAGATVDLGTFAAGTELIFHVVADTTGTDWAQGTSGFKDAGSVYDWYTGPGSRNSDGYAHAWVDDTYTGSFGGTAVGFEDLPQLGDAGFEDLIYSFTSVTARTSVPDVSSTLPLLGTGLAGLLAFARRFKK